MPTVESERARMEAAMQREIERNPGSSNSSSSDARSGYQGIPKENPGEWRWVENRYLNSKPYMQRAVMQNSITGKKKMTPYRDIRNDKGQIQKSLLWPEGNAFRIKLNEDNGYTAWKKEQDRIAAEAAAKAKAAADAKAQAAREAAAAARAEATRKAEEARKAEAAAKAKAEQEAAIAKAKADALAEAQRIAEAEAAAAAEAERVRLENEAIEQAAAAKLQAQQEAAAAAKAKRERQKALRDAAVIDPAPTETTMPPVTGEPVQPKLPATPYEAKTAEVYNPPGYVEGEVAPTVEGTGTSSQALVTSPMMAKQMAMPTSGGTAVVNYSNDQGSIIPVTEVDGKPISYVPEGYRKIGMNQGGVVGYAEGGDSDSTLNAEYQLATKFLGYKGPKSRPALNDFMKASPGAAARMGKYQQAMMGMAEGGVVSQLPTDKEPFNEPTQEEIIARLRELEEREQLDPAFIPTPTRGPQYSVPAASDGTFSYDKDVVPAFGQAVQQTMQPIQSGVDYMQPLPTQDISTLAGQVGAAAPTTTAATVPTVETANLPAYTPASTYSAATVSPYVMQQTAGLQAAQGAIPQEQQVQAQQGQLSAGATPTAPQFDTDYLKQAEERAREVSPQEMTEFAKVGIMPQAGDKGFESPYEEAESARFITTTPEAKPATEYDLGTLQGAQAQVTNQELVKAKGLGLTAEQAALAVSSFSPTIEAATRQLAEGEIATAQDAYNISPTQFAQQASTVVQNAAKASQIPDAQSAQSMWQSTLQGAQGTVGAQELANANNIIGATQAVTSIAATVDALNNQSIMQASQGSFSQAALATAAQGTVDPAQTVQGQMNQLMEQFKNGTPVWAAGAMRAANSAMASRGLAGSSMAGAAIVQATMEAAIPIAAQDAQFYQQVGMQNLSNRQQVSLANAAAQQNITLQNLSNSQQAALQNSTNSFALQSQNLTNQQAVVLSNAQMKAALQNKTLDIKTQTALTNAAKYTEMNRVNISNEQQSLLQASAENLQVDMANLSNSQQTALSNLQVRASLIGQELSNEQQTAMLQSTQTFERAGFNANAQQTALLQDAQAKAALEGRALDVRQQTALFNASRVAELNDINLTNKQQALLQESAQVLQIETQNLSNRQQTELANAQVRAALQGKVLDNEQQTEIINAARYAEANNITVSNKQAALVQSFVTNSTLQGKVLDNTQQASIFNTSAVLEERKIDLTNEQQTRLFNTTNNLQRDVAELSNRQQTALANAQIEATLRGQELSNEQQSAVLNAEKFAEANNITYTTNQQTQLANSQLMQSVGLANLNANQATTLQNAAQLAGMDMQNLNNRQQAAVQQAQNFLSMNMANLTNTQQTAIFKSQQNIQSLFTDQAADNASAQFNAANENQTRQFFSSLANQTGQFNAAQTNALNQFNIDEINSIREFNAGIQQQRDQFNATNSLVVAQANAQWRQNLATLNTAAQNESNATFAATINAMTSKNIDAVWQRERDLMSYNYTSAESAKDRALQIVLGDQTLEALREKISYQEDSAKTEFSYRFLFGDKGILGGII